MRWCASWPSAVHLPQNWRIYCDLRYWSNCGDLFLARERSDFIPRTDLGGIQRFRRSRGANRFVAPVTSDFFEVFKIRFV